MVHPSFHFGDGAFGRLARSDDAVIDHRRGDSAGPDTAGGDERHLIVGGRLARFDPNGLLDRLEDFVGALHVAGRAHAHDAGMFPLGLEAEEMIEGGDPKHPARRHPQVMGDKIKEVVVQVAKKLLGAMQDLDQGLLLKLVPLDLRLQYLIAFIAPGRPGDRPGGFIFGFGTHAFRFGWVETTPTAHAMDCSAPALRDVGASLANPGRRDPTKVVTD